MSEPDDAAHAEAALDHLRARWAHVLDQAYAARIAERRAVANDRSVWWPRRWINRQAADSLERSVRRRFQEPPALLVRKWRRDLGLE